MQKKCRALLNLVLSRPARDRPNSETSLLQVKTTFLYQHSVVTEVTLQAHQTDGLRLDIDCQYTSYSTHLYVQNVHILMLLLLFSYINSGNSALVQPLISRLLALMLPQPGNH